MSKIVIGNWKMNGDPKLVSRFLQMPQKSFENAVICPPFPLLSCFKKSSIKFGAQDCHTHEKGAFTGSVGAHLLKIIGCSYVIIGHSERRQAGDDDKLIAQKVQAALQAGVTPILCVGEREGEDPEVILADQLKSWSEGALIAYEPVWAIGTGRVPELTTVERIHQLLKSKYTCQVLYGGSVTAANCSDILKLDSVEGLLVGGASLDPEQFAAICDVASKCIS